MEISTNDDHGHKKILCSEKSPFNLITEIYCVKDYFKLIENIQLKRYL